MSCGSKWRHYSIDECGMPSRGDPSVVEISVLSSIDYEAIAQISAQSESQIVSDTFFFLLPTLYTSLRCGHRWSLTFVTPWSMDLLAGLPFPRKPTDTMLHYGERTQDMDADANILVPPPIDRHCDERRPRRTVGQHTIG
jgi:hypothetical protein